MKIAVLRFPGSNCDQDALHSLRDDMGLNAEYVWHAETSLAGFDGAFVPGGFSYGDYLRCGAMAGRAAIIPALREMADSGRPILGACNGFQILCEAGLLPGALLENASGKFTCNSVTLIPESTKGPFMTGVTGPITLPIAHREGRYVADENTLDELESENRVAFRYADGEKVNGSSRGIAGILNARGNVLGLMPHPERASNSLLGNDDGLSLLNGFALLSV